MSLGVIVPIDVHNFKEHQLQQLKVDFGNFDKNGNGRLDKKEFVQWLVHNGSTEKNAKHAFEIADVNKDGTLSLNEFLDYARKLDDVQLNGDLDEYIRMVFKAADKKKEGEQPSFMLWHIFLDIRKTHPKVCFSLKKRKRR